MIKVWYDLGVPPETLEIVRKEAQLIGPNVNPNPDDPLDELEEADAAFIGAVFPASQNATYVRAKKLKVLTRLGIGYDSVDLQMATEHGVCVMNTPDAPTESTAELAFGFILNLARNITVANKTMKEGQWPKVKKQTGFELVGKTLGLVGLGRIGGRMVEIAHVFGMKVVAYDPFVSAERARELGVELLKDLSDLYQKSDMVSLHVPALPETQGMINKESLAQMKKGSYLINVARGALVVEADLLEALQSGQLAGAALDVWETEPTAVDNPLRYLENVVASPHIAGVTREMMHKAITVATRNMLMALRGEQPPTLLNPEVWENRRRD